MKIKTTAAALTASVLSLGGASAQGLLSIGADDDFDSGLPFTVTLGLSAGYDNNVNLANDSGAEEDSSYITGGVAIGYGMEDRTTKLRLGAEYSVTHYFDVESVDDTYHSGRLRFDISHDVSRRLSIGNNSYVAYEIEPDYDIAASTDRRTDNYLYFYNNTSVAYAWSRRFSTVTNYAINGIFYDEGVIADTEDRLSHTFGHQLRYMLDRTTTLTAEYRFTYTDYDVNDRDNWAHYALVGVDHAFSSQLQGSLRVGAEFRDYSSGGNNTAPYLEGALSYRAAKDTTLRWYNRLGYEDNEVSSYESRYSYRTGLSLSQRLASNLTAVGGVHYAHSEFEDSPIFSDVSEDLVSLSLGLNYQLTTNVMLNANYHFTNVASDNEAREYDRHRVSLGATVTF